MFDTVQLYIEKVSCDIRIKQILSKIKKIGLPVKDKTCQPFVVITFIFVIPFQK